VGAVREHFPQPPGDSADAIKRGAGVIGGLATISTAAMGVLFPPAGALIATGGALATAGASTAVIASADASARDRSPAATQGDPRHTLYMNELQACLREHGFALRDSQPAGVQYEHHRHRPGGHP